MEIFGSVLTQKIQPNHALQPVVTTVKTLWRNYKILTGEELSAVARDWTIFVTELTQAEIRICKCQVSCTGTLQLWFHWVGCSTLGLPAPRATTQLESCWLNISLILLFYVNIIFAAYLMWSSVWTNLKSTGTRSRSNTDNWIFDWHNYCDQFYHYGNSKI